MNRELDTPEKESLQYHRRSAAGAGGLLVLAGVAYPHVSELTSSDELANFIRLGCKIEIGILSVVAVASSIVAWDLSEGLGPMERPDKRPHDPPRRSPTSAEI